MSIFPYVFEPPGVLRGVRNYVHSTDMYDSIMLGAEQANLSFEGPIELRIRSTILLQPRYIYLPASEHTPEAVAICKFKSGEKSFVSVVIETESHITVRRKYDESPVTNKSKIIGLTAQLKDETGLRPIESLTSLGVHLHKIALPPKAGERWVLGQLFIRRCLSELDSSCLYLSIDKNIGSTMTRTSIEAHDGTLGFMTFMLAKG